MEGKQKAILESKSLGEKIKLIIQGLPPKEVNIIEIINSVGNDSLLFLTIFLSLIFLVPISIPGVSTVFGTGILLIGFSRLFNRKPWIPKAIAYRQLSSERLRYGLERALVWFHRLERISRPHRMPQLTSAGWFIPMNHMSFILSALLLMMPFGLIPFSNTLPALALIFLSVGILQKDGCFILLGYFVNLITILFFAILIIASGWSIHELVKFLH